MFKLVSVLLFLILSLNSASFAQKSPITDTNFKEKTKWLAKHLKEGGDFTRNGVRTSYETKISEIKFEECLVKVKRTIETYNSGTDIRTLETQPDFMKDERYQVGALKNNKSTDMTTFDLRDMDPGLIKIDLNPDKKLIGKNSKLVGIIIPTINEDKAVATNLGKLPMYSTRIQFFVKREKAEQIKQIFADVIKKCQ